MDPTRASVTALATSLMRAIHTRADRPAVIDDPWGDRLIGERERSTLGGPEAETALRAHPTYGTVILRTRYVEDALEAAVARGIDQYAIVGAGLDSFALRRPAFARELKIFEVDHPATQDDKRRRLREAGVTAPDALHFIAADLSAEGLGAALGRSDFRVGAPTFFSWLGVTSYLSREANLATLREMARVAGEGSEAVFTYIDQREFEPATASPETRRIRETLSEAGEPWVSGFHPAHLEAHLKAVGMALIEDLAGEALRARHPGCGLSPAPFIHVARARVTG